MQVTLSQEVGPGVSSSPEGSDFINTESSTSDPMSTRRYRRERERESRMPLRFNDYIVEGKHNYGI